MRHERGNSWPPFSVTFARIPRTFGEVNRMKKSSVVSRSGRFANEPAADVAQFTESISFDWRLWEQDIAGSIAHATMLVQ